MSQHWQIRKANIDDAYGLKLCMDFAYEPYKERMQGLRLPPMDSDYELEIEHFPTWVVEYQDGKIIGGLILNFEKAYATIVNIAVHPEFQGEGIGGALMQFAENSAKEKHYTQMRLATHILLNENIDLYLHLGWYEKSHTSSKVLMEKEI